MDHLLGRAVDRLKRVGLYDRAAILVTADHGISFAPGLELGTRNLRPENQHEVAWVPFLLKSPGQVAGEVRDDNVMGIDVAPTIADLAGVDIPWEVEGISLLGDPRPNQSKPWFNTPGTETAIDGARAFPRVLAGAVSELVQAEEGQQGAFSLRAYADLVGTPTSSLVSTGGPVGLARLDRPEAFRQLDLTTSVLPSLVTGHLELPSGQPPPATVALVLNGTPTPSRVSSLPHRCPASGSSTAGRNSAHRASRRRSRSANRRLPSCVT